MTFYHGTSTIFPIGNYLMPPSFTDIQREEWRKNFTDVVFLTISRKSAEYYARKACEYFGGTPIVYKCIPAGRPIHLKDTEWIADKARVIERL